MISQLRGILTEVKDEAAVVQVGGLAYEVLVPARLIQPLRSRLRAGAKEELAFHTLHYIEGGAGGSNLIPRLIGFLDENDRDFFAQLTRVKGVGVRKALKAFVLPAKRIALAIEQSDRSALSRLPEIGGRTADKIIAELKGKLARFALMREGEEVPRPEPEALDIREETMAILVHQLQYNRAEAENMIDRALRQRPEVKSSQELIQEIYRQQAAE